MKRRTVLILSVLWTVLLVVLLGSCSKVGIGRVVTSTYDITDEIKDVTVSIVTTDINILPSEDGKIRVVCVENSLLKNEVSVSNGVLKVYREKHDSGWLETFAKDDNNSVTVYLPVASYGDLSLGATTGDVSVGSGLSFDSFAVDNTTGDISVSGVVVVGDARIKVTTGNITLDNFSAASLLLNGTTGDQSLSRVATVGDVTLENSTGDVTLSGVSAGGSIGAKVTTGDVLFGEVATAGGITVDGSSGTKTYESVICGGELYSKTTTGASILRGVDCASLTVNSTTGTVTLADVIAAGLIKVDVGSGGVVLEASDAPEFDIKCTTGGVRGTILSSKVFMPDTTTGDVKVPYGTSGGTFKVKTTSGDIEIEVLN